MAQLQQNHYGKSRVRLMKVTRTGGHHEVREWNVGLYLEGDFARCFTGGDNSGIMATDTMKNTVYSAARDSSSTTVEGYARDLAHILTERNPQVQQVRIVIEEKSWIRLKADGQQHGSAFLQRGPEVTTAELVLRPGSPPTIRSGIRGLVILKTAHSAFTGFKRDAWTTLPESDDRLLGTEATIVWSYARPLEDDAAYAAARKRIMDALLTTFANHNSLSVQHTLYAMAEAALAAEPAITELELTMPNRHNIPVDLSRFGQDNPNQIFMPTDEPHGHIHARVVR